MSRSTICFVVCGCCLLAATAHVRALTIDVTVELSGPIVDAPLERCICFDVYRDCLHCPVRVCEVLAFGPPGHAPGIAQGQIEVEDAQYLCIEAVDPLHTLRSMDPDFLGGTTATFTGDPDLGGNWLVSGNLNGDAVIDALDLGICEDEEVTYYGTGDTFCNQLPPHADLNGDGVADILDRGVIVAYFDSVSTECCGGAIPAGPDGDGVPDECDNCAYHYNPGQEDGNGDGIGDACAGIPTVSEWGVVVMAMLMLTAGTLVFKRRCPAWG